MLPELTGHALETVRLGYPTVHVTSIVLITASPWRGRSSVGSRTPRICINTTFDPDGRIGQIVWRLNW